MFDQVFLHKISVFNEEVAHAPFQVTASGSLITWTATRPLVLYTPYCFVSEHDIMQKL